MALSLREKLIGGFSGAVMAAAATVTPAAIAPNTAEASDYSCPAEITVPCIDGRGFRAEVVRTRAARESVGNRVVLIHYGGDQSIRDTAERVVQFFNQNGVQTGLLLADGPETYQIYIDAQAITNEFSARGVSAQQLGQYLNQSIIAHREVAVVAPGANAQPGG